MLEASLAPGGTKAACLLINSKNITVQMLIFSPCHFPLQNTPIPNCFAALIPVGGMDSMGGIAWVVPGMAGSPLLNQRMPRPKVEDCHVRENMALAAESPREPASFQFHVLKSLDTFDYELSMFGSLWIVRSARYRGCPCHPWARQGIKTRFSHGKVNKLLFRSLIWLGCFSANPDLWSAVYWSYLIPPVHLR